MSKALTKSLTGQHIRDYETNLQGYICESLKFRVDLLFCGTNFPKVKYRAKHLLPGDFKSILFNHFFKFDQYIHDIIKNKAKTLKKCIIVPNTKYEELHRHHLYYE